MWEGLGRIFSGFKRVRPFPLFFFLSLYLLFTGSSGGHRLIMREKKRGEESGEGIREKAGLSSSRMAWGASDQWVGGNVVKKKRIARRRGEIRRASAEIKESKGLQTEMDMSFPKKTIDLKKIGYNDSRENSSSKK